MAKLTDLTDDDVWDRWRADIERIKQDAYELFSARRTFREIADVFANNPQLQETGGHLWQWMLVNYTNFVIMRIRRETDDQGNTISMTRLLLDIADCPTVITRRRYMDMLSLKPGSHRIQMNERYFTDIWMSSAATGPDDVVDAVRVAEDRRSLDTAAARVQKVGNLLVAHRQRVDVRELRVPEVDGAFDAIEETITKYYTLLHGSTIIQLEPAPQFNTTEAFMFPWIVCKEPLGQRS